jgi:hypothetical protein
LLTIFYRNSQLSVTTKLTSRGDCKRKISDKKMKFIRIHAEDLNSALLRVDVVNKTSGGWCLPEQSLDIADVMGEGNAVVRVVLATPLSVAEQVEVQAFTPSVVEFACRKHIESESIFTGSFRLAVSLKALQGGRATAWVSAAPEDQLDAVLVAVSAQRNRVEVLCTSEVAVAALAAAVVAEPVLVHWLRERVLTTLLVERGAQVSWSRTQRINGDIKTLAQDAKHEPAQDWEPLVNAAESMLPADLRTKLNHRLFMGLPVALPDRSNGAFLARADATAALQKLFKGLDPAAVLKNPDLYGLALVPITRSLTPQPYREQVQLTRLSRSLATGLALASMLATATAAWSWVAADAATNGYTQQLELMSTRVDQTKKQLPEKKLIDELKTAVGVAGEGLVSLRVDYFLAEFARRLPAGAQVTRINVQRQVAVKGGASGYDVAFLILIPGDYGKTKRQAEQMVVDFGAFGKLSNTKLVHDPDAALGGVATLDGTLAVSAANF